MTRPLLPEKLGDLDETQQSEEMELYRWRLVHYHYLKSTAEFSELHFAAFADPKDMFRRTLFRRASDPWEGETLALKVALIRGTNNWETGRRSRGAEVLVRLHKPKGCPKSFYFSE